MAYIDDEKSVRAGRPNELYRFVGMYKSYYYTSGPKAVSYGQDAEGNPIVYQPIALERSEVTAGTQDDDGLDISIDLPVTTEIVQDYGFQLTPPDLFVTIYRYHDINSIVTYWQGPVTSMNTSENVTTVRSTSPLAAALDGTVPNVYYQAPCNHVLYDTRCKVAFADWSQQTVVSAIAGRAITVGNVGALDGKLKGGEIALASGERRTIVAQADKVLTVNYPFSGAAVGVVATIAAGCNMAYTGDCATKFANQKNFGGFPFVPADNPFSDGIDEASSIPDNVCPDDCHVPWAWHIRYTISATGPLNWWFDPCWFFRDNGAPYGEFPSQDIVFSGGASTISGKPTGWQVDCYMYDDLDDGHYMVLSVWLHGSFDGATFLETVGGNPRVRIQSRRANQQFVDCIDPNNWIRLNDLFQYGYHLATDNGQG